MNFSSNRYPYPIAMDAWSLPSPFPSSYGYFSSSFLIYFAFLFTFVVILYAIFSPSTNNNSEKIGLDDKNKKEKLVFAYINEVNRLWRHVIAAFGWTANYDLR